MSAPLASHGTTPYLFPALVVHLHLEPLAPEDAARLDRAADLVRDWIGAELRHTLHSRVGRVEPFRAEDLDYMAEYPATLDFEAEGGPDDDAFVAAGLLAAARRHELGLACHAGTKRFDASPTTFRFWAEVPGFGPGPRLRARASMKVSVPVDAPQGDFRARAVELASCLRLRWGAAGLGYAANETQWYKQSDRAIYAHARRHPGFDVGHYVAHGAEFHEWVRTVNWLTFLGPTLVARLPAPPRPTRLVTVDRAGDATLLVAGDRPEPGDVNRVRWPAAYLEADAIVRPVRAGEGVSFYEAWTERTTGEWLRRFERRLA